MDKINNSKETNTGKRKTIYTALLCVILGAACMYWSIWLFFVYGPLFFIAFILGIVVIVKGQVLAGLTITLATSVLPGIMFLILVVLPNKTEIRSFVAEWSGKAGMSELVIKHEAAIGEKVVTPKIELELESVKRKRRIGTLLRHVKPSHGAIFIAVKWKYKNISDKPISPIMKPTLNLISPNGEFYNTDVRATKIGSKMLKVIAVNSVNPDITVNLISVFEVDHATAKMDGWRAIIKADEPICITLD